MTGRRTLQNLILAVVSFLATLGVVEFLLRFTAYEGMARAGYSYPRHYFESHPLLGYDIATQRPATIHALFDHPYEVFSNRLGCFDYDRPIDSPYLLVVGDSFAWGYAPLPDKWTTLLEKRSGELVLKCGVTGYGTRQALGKVEQVIEAVGHAPRWIVLLYTANDLNDDFGFPQRTVVDGHLVNRFRSADLRTGEKRFRSDAELERDYAEFSRGGPRAVGRRLVRQSVLAAVLRLSVMPGLRALALGDGKAAGPSGQPPLPPTLNGLYRNILSQYCYVEDRPWLEALVAQHADTLRALARVARDADGRFLLIDADGALANDRYSDLLREFTAWEGVEYYNLAADYPNPSRWPNDPHWDIRGNAEAAEHIWRRIVEINFLDRD